MNELSIDDIAPDFCAPSILNNTTYQNTKLSDLREKFVVLYFYPKDNTPGCNIEAQGFNSLLMEFGKFNTEIIGVSKDDLSSHNAFCQSYNLGFHLISDKNSDICEKYGVWEEKSFLGKKYMGINRTTFLIDPNGKIAYIWKKVPTFGHAKSVLSKVKELTPNENV